MNYMKGLPEGVGWSPDGGMFDKVGDKVFWETGEVSDCKAGGVFRVGFGTHPDHERISQWTDEKRAEVLAKNQAIWEQNKLQALKEETARMMLVDRARAKLTEDEFNAVLKEGER